MSFESLLAQDKIRAVEKKRFDSSLAERDLNAAGHNLEDEEYDWALSIAYNAVLQAGRAVMFHLQ